MGETLNKYKKEGAGETSDFEKMMAQLWLDTQQVIVLCEEKVGDDVWKRADSRELIDVEEILLKGKEVCDNLKLI